MRQLIGSLAPRIAPLPPQLRAADGSSGHGHRLLSTSGERLGRVTALHVAPKSCPLQGAAAAAIRRNSHLLDQDAARKDKFFEVEMTVQDDDLDEYGVVNNAVYASYIHRGRDLLLEKLGISVGNLAAMGKAMALSELNLKFFAPLRSGDRFVVKVKPLQIKGVRMVVLHVIETLPDRKLVLEARGTAVFLNKDYFPTRVFPELSTKVRDMFPCMEG